MVWTDPVDLYCERLTPDFWAEPANAASNLGFVLVGLWFWQRARRAQADAFVQVLCLWVGAIGIGSFLFHTLATRGAGLLDVVPIWSFVLVYAGFTLRRFLGLDWLRVALAMLLYVLAAAGAMALIPAQAVTGTNGSVQYLPAILALVAFGTALARAGRPAWRSVAAAGIVFAISLVARSLDMTLCPAFALGTHWAWHLLNAAMLALLLRAAVLSSRRAVPFA